MSQASKTPSPIFVLEEEKLIKNLKILNEVKKKSDAKILLALKAFSMYESFDLVRKYLDGTTSSGLHEALLADEYFKKESHVYSPAYKLDEIKTLAKICDHIVFNSINQLETFYKHTKHLSLGLRINPEISVSPVEFYSPSAPNSRLGVTLKNFSKTALSKLEGLAFHALCEQNVDALELVLESFVGKFGKFFNQLKWVNFGGGHHITRQDYDTKRLIALIKEFKSNFKHLEVYLEPGEAVAWQSGYLKTTVLDIVENGLKIAILDTSAEAHMIDTIIMPYKAKIRGADEPNVLAHNYRLGAVTCLAGDYMGDYSFNKELKIGDEIIFEDMIHYTMVKTTTFNGINLPAIGILRSNNTIDIIKTFGYKEFKARL